MGYIVWAGSSPQSYGLFLASTAPWRRGIFFFGVSPQVQGHLPYFAEIGYSLGMPETTRRFDCPNCGADYKVVRAEGDPPPDRQIECRRCGAPLQGRDAIASPGDRVARTVGSFLSEKPSIKSGLRRSPEQSNAPRGSLSLLPQRRLLLSGGPCRGMCYPDRACLERI
jgi:predicted RNA-binding Zn-ribbon protein involved in translation (DUF1610 family)